MLMAFAGRGSVALGDTDPEPDASANWSGSRSLLQHFGISAARRLLQTAATRADGLRAVERASALGTAGTLLLVQALTDHHGIVRSDSHVLLAATRALAPLAGDKPVARALAEFVLSGSFPRAARPVASGDLDGADDGRVELARGTAALALARARSEDSTELLVATARRAGIGRPAALRAISDFPPAFPVTVPYTADGVTVAGAASGVRALGLARDVIRGGDAASRAIALRLVGELGDRGDLRLIEEALADESPRVREAAAAALAALGGQASAPVRALIDADRTARFGIALSVRVPSEDVTRALAARARAGSDLALRRASVAALARQPSASSLEALAALLDDPVLEGDAAEAVARSVVPSAWRLVDETLRKASTQRLGARMAALRSRLSGVMPSSVRALLETLSRAPLGCDRAIGIASLVLTGVEGPGRGLRDADSAVRRAVAMASEPTDASHAAALLDAYRSEKDAATSRVLSRALVRGASRVPQAALRDALHAGGTDAPLAALALASRGDTGHDLVLAALGSPDPIVRAHAARGLAAQPDAWASGLLARAYEGEVDTGVRSIAVLALAERTGDVTLSVRARALELASDFDPDPGVRVVAERARAGLPAPRVTSRGAVIVRASTTTGAAPEGEVEGLVVRADGLALPVVFDEDGYVLLAAPDGPARVLLSPRLPAQAP